MKPSEVVRQSILEGLKVEVVDWHVLEKATDSLLDTKKISNLKEPLGDEDM